MKRQKLFSLFTLGVLMLSFLAIFIQLPTVSATTVLGNTDDTGGSIGLSANTIYYFGPFTAQSTGYIDEILVSILAAGHSIMGLYSDSGSNTPSALLATTNTATGITPWATFGGIHYQVTNGAKYWFAFLSDDTFILNVSPSGSWVIRSQIATYPTLPVTASSSSGGTVTLPAVYATVLNAPLTVSNEAATSYIGLPPTFSALWSTTETLSYFIVQTNRTGTAVNETAQAFTSTWSNYTASWNLPSMACLEWAIYANTTWGAWATTGLQQTTAHYTSFTISGPYIEDNGAVANSAVQGTVYFTNGMSQVFTLNGTGGTAESYAINPAYTPLSVTWQAIANYSYTRTYYLTGTTAANVTVFIPNPASTPQIYQFTISDFYGVTDPYIASSAVVGGNLTSQSYIIERKPLTVGTVSLIMEQWHSYTLQLQCDQGIYSVEFSAEGTFLTNINIPAGAFPISNTTYPTADAQRTNSTAITITYSDPTSSTTSLNVAIVHKNGLVTVTDYNSTVAADTLTTIWNYAVADVTYTVYVTAISDGVTYPFAFIAPAQPPSNPFDNALDWLGPSSVTLPHITLGWPAGVDPAQIFASIIIVAALCIGSFKSAGISCLISALVGGVLAFVMGWWQSAVPIWSFSIVVAILILIDEWRQSSGGYMVT